LNCRRSGHSSVADRKRGEADGIDFGHRSDRGGGIDRGEVLGYPPTSRRVASTATYADHFSSGLLVEH
jgi:hypothetical protein